MNLDQDPGLENQLPNALTTEPQLKKAPFGSQATNLIFSGLVRNADGTETRRSARRRRSHRRQRRQASPLPSDGSAEAVLVAELHVAQLPAHETTVLLLQLLLVSEIPG